MNNGVVTAYDAKTHSSVLTLPDYGSRLMAMSVSRSGMVAVAHYQGTTPTPPSIYSFYDLGTSVSMWDLGMKKRLYTLPHFSAVRDLEFSPDGKYLAIGSFYPALQIYDAQSGKLHRTAQFYRGGIGYLVFSDDGTILRGLGENIYQEWRVR
jgi:WD40 repeat protein